VTPDLNDADAVAAWMRTSPPAHQQAQALDDLIGVFGNDRALSIYALGIAIANGEDRT
jgi:hypothetical protein